MKLARVVGTVVSTINAPDFDGRTLLVCDLLDPSGKPAGGYMIAVDSVGAGAGETVLLLDEGNSARQVLAAPGAPIRTVVVGIVDAVTGAEVSSMTITRDEARDDPRPLAADPAPRRLGHRPSARHDAVAQVRRRQGRPRRPQGRAPPRAGQPSEHLEEIVVHELIHLRLYAMDQMLVQLLDAVFGADADDPKREFAETQFMTLLESTTEDLAKALLAASGSTAPLTFGRLREEVEREIGPEAVGGVTRRTLRRCPRSASRSPRRP